MDPLGESPWADTPAQPPPPPSTSETATAGDDATSKPAELAPSSATSSGPRPSRLTPRRLVAQPTKLQAVEDDPLGPLGAGGDATLPGTEGAPPMPPQKERSTPAAMVSTLPVRTTMSAGQQQQQQARPGAPADPHRIDDDDELLDDGRIGGRAPPPVQAAQPAGRGMGPPSVSVEQAAKPSFTITVGDPHKVGDLTSSHIVYAVRTKVCRGSFFPVFPPFCGMGCGLDHELTGTFLIDYIQGL